MNTEQFRREREKLRLLCSLKLSVGERMAFCEEWKAEQFLDGVHRVIFEEICAMRMVDAERLREMLPGRVANLGFPDVEMREYF